MAMRMDEKILDAVTKSWLKIIFNDPDLDVRLGRLLNLFAVPMPELWGNWKHHHGGR